jgi:triacylglycerol lipase
LFDFAGAALYVDFMTSGAGADGPPARDAPTSPHPVNCPRLNAPIVLAHGLMGFRRLGFGPLALQYFGDIPAALRASGNRVLVSRVHPTAGIRRRGLKLAERIEAAFPGEAVHIIGHSMGGLDARALLAQPGWRDRVLSLTTIATPHLGSALADLAADRLGWIYRALKGMRWDHQGFLDITRPVARAFHEANPAPEGVPCFSIAGDPPRGGVLPPMRRVHALLGEIEGPNDGLVPVTSSLAFGQTLEVWDADHFRQLNWSPPSRGFRAGILEGYARLARRLAEFDPAKARAFAG